MGLPRPRRHRDARARHLGSVLARVRDPEHPPRGARATPPTPWYHNPAVGFWFFALAITTGIAAVAALVENVGLVAVPTTLATGSGILAAGFIHGSHGTVEVAGWVLVLAADGVAHAIELDWAEPGVKMGQ